MQGGKSAEWVDEDFYEVFTNKANAFVTRNQDTPFFLFFSFHDIHVPRLPAQKFLGQSKLGIRGDAILQMDYITGQVTQHLERSQSIAPQSNAHWPVGIKAASHSRQTKPAFRNDGRRRRK